ncbi:hypothetical protein CLAFUW4_12141 [Fulvia fulva]|uniref:Uncharacterized protein n=1 Tax=Passalora fulva TaxID=5499 RepID=A0A9Q8PDM3_PASFU|nr:uncharacterized protein CLAFUR5_11180 [Fulvia fulva]KAK4618583.1 hypothetical protein CLAFUR0_12157 [Fulvia fulva]UJO20524.1 hypothetical protein CLAFUR5_11180 [Fulvia fulva]WPV17898.1 hypothetical protein CLAFUW4_12141 [Fulvia fulva]WPV33382.1 hypothetical protein CLAFUW7_12148 [Fulvia fulva]
MSFSGGQPSMLPLLYQQHNHYVAELGHTHQALSKLYKKLATVERVLAERQERELSRSDKKKWQYTRSLAKKAVGNLESQQAMLHDHLRQCNNLIASYEQGGEFDTPVTPWTAQIPPSPFLYTPFSPVGASPWTSHQHQPSTNNGTETAPQYWDLSMLRERRLSSPYGSTATADSGFYESVAHGLNVNAEPFNHMNHVYAHELVSPVFYSPFAGSFGTHESSLSPTRRERSDVLPELLMPTSPVKVGAQSSHKRCYSVNAVQLIESRLAAPNAKPQRGMSVGGISGKRNEPDNGLDENTQGGGMSSIIAPETETTA